MKYPLYSPRGISPLQHEPPLSPRDHDEIDYESLSPAEQTRIDDRMCELAAEELSNLVSDRAKTFLALQSSTTLYELARGGIRYFSGSDTDMGPALERLKTEFVARFAGDYIDEALQEALDRLRGLNAEPYE